MKRKWNEPIQTTWFGGPWPLWLCTLVALVIGAIVVVTHLSLFFMYLRLSGSH